MYAEEDWGRVYYAVIKKQDSPQRMEVWGTGPSILSAKNDACDTMAVVFKKQPATFRRYLDVLTSCGLYTYVRPFTASMTSLAIIYCEAKVHIYGRRYGYKNMRVILDPTYRDDLLRFAGYDKENE